MGQTAIEWSDLSDNWQAGCTEAGPECDNCYARLMSARLRRFGQARYQDVVGDDGRWTGAIVFEVDALNRAFDRLERRRKPARMFPGSMTDLWHKDAPRDAQVLLAQRVRRLAEIGTPHRLTFLSKRPGLMAAWQREFFPDGLPPLFWAGTTAGTRGGWRARVRALREVQAGTRFVSAEPLLEDVDAAGEMEGIAWVIAGCESDGPRPGKRPTEDVWVRRLRDAVKGAGAAFFLKQLTAGRAVVGTPEMDGRRWVEFPDDGLPLPA